MTIAKTDSSASYAGDDVTTAFSFPYRFFDDTDLSVYVVDSLGVSTLQTLTTHYTVSNTDTEAGGTVTMVTAPATGETLLIERNIPSTQSVDYQTNDAFPAETHEAALDRLTLISQQSGRSNDLALRYPTGDAASPVLPTSVARADSFLGFDSSGEPVALAGTTEAIVSVAMEPVVGANTLALARTAMGVVTLAGDTMTGPLKINPDTLVGLELFGRSSDNEFEIRFSLNDDSGYSTFRGEPGADEFRFYHSENTDLAAKISAGGTTMPDPETVATREKADARYPNIESGAGAPSSTPGKIGDKYLDTTNDDVYEAYGVASSADWIKTGGGALVLLATSTLANDATADFTAFDNSTYESYIFYFSNVVPSSDNQDFWVRTSTDGGTSYDDGADTYSWIVHGAISSNTIAQTDAADDTKIILNDTGNPGPGSASGEDGVSGWLVLHGPGLAKKTQITSQIFFQDADGAYQIHNGGGQRASSADVDAIRFLFSSGNLESGTIKMYGMVSA